MKKTVLLAGIGALVASANAMAMDITPYAAIRAGAVVNQTDTDVTSAYKFNKTFDNRVSDKTHSDTVFGARVAFGATADFDAYGALRGELELNWNGDATDSNDFDFKIINKYTHSFETKTKVYGAMANLYYDIATGTKFTPFVGAGAGMAHVKVSSGAHGTVEKQAFSINGDATDNNFAWNATAGVAYNISDSIVLDIAYRYTDLGAVKSTDTFTMDNLKGKMTTDAKFDIATHEVMLGARYRF